MTMQISTVTDEQFVNAWQASTSINEVATKLKMTYAGVSARAGRMRKAKVKLKPMQRGTVKREIDTKTLNKLIESKSKS